MKTLRPILLSALLVATAAVATNDGKLKAADLSDPYNVNLVVTEAGDHSVWHYTLTKTHDDTEPLANFIINLAACGDQSPKMTNILSATVNGVDWMSQITSSDSGSGCTVTGDNYVEFTNLPVADSYVIEFTLDDVYPQMDTTAWFKTTSLCKPKTILGPGCKGYIRTTTMDADFSTFHGLYSDINTYMRQFGFDYTENPNCTGGFGSDIDGVHALTTVDYTFNRWVFQFNIHITPIIDGDRCSTSTDDRQRNEMKSITENNVWAKVQGNWDEWQILEWKFKIPAGFQPTSSFTHIHQLKAQDGPNNGSAVITITPRANSNGTNKRVQVIHSVDGASTGKGTIVDNIPLSAFEDQWVQVRETVHYNHAGFYSIQVTRISDGQVLIDFTDPNIDMWRIGSSYIRNKYGIYRSLGGGHLANNPVGQSPLLKNESLFLSDFRIYEKNTNPTPGVPHN